jgi:DNA-binding transcriptional ArsR family regulator
MIENPGETQAGQDPCTTPPDEPAAVAEITALLQALADPVRMAIIRGLALTGDPRACGSFELAVTKSTLSHHFRVLREAGVIDAHYEGTRKLITLRRDELEAVYPGLLDSVLKAAQVSHPLPEPAAS